MYRMDPSYRGEYYKQRYIAKETSGALIGQAIDMRER